MFSNLKTLVGMQLKDKLDLSFLKSRRSAILKIGLSLLKFAVVTILFYLLFYICSILHIFSWTGNIPDTVIGVLFCVVEILAIVSCTVGLTSTLYMTPDNRVLLTLPVTSGEIFISKLILYLVFELKRNLFFTLPMFLAYGIVRGAVFLYYPWLIVCFFIISFVPVLLGAVLSIPSLFIATFVSHFKWLQATIVVLGCALVTWFLIKLISVIPANINILGQWGSIFTGIQKFLTAFCAAFYPLYKLVILTVGGTLRINSFALFGWDTLLTFIITLAILAALFFIAYSVAKPLFFKMASKLFEFEKMVVPPKKNKVHSRFLSPYSETYKMEFRNTRQIVAYAIQLVLPGIALLLLNKLYAAMNTSYTGQIMTKTFNFLVLLIISLAFNANYATIYSKEAQARNVLKTRPQNPLNYLFARISFRAVICVFAVMGAVTVYNAVGDISAGNCALLAVIGSALTLGHLFWSAELDVMHSQADQYATLGMDFNNPNETKATILGFVISVIATFVFYFFANHSGMTGSLIRCTILCAAFLAARIYLFCTRVKLYFKEN